MKNREDSFNPKDFKDEKYEDFENYQGENPFENNNNNWNTIYKTNSRQQNNQIPNGEYNFSYRRKNNQNAWGEQNNPVYSSPIDSSTISKKPKNFAGAKFFLVTISSLLALLGVAFLAYKLSDPNSLTEPKDLDTQNQNIPQVEVKNRTGDEESISPAQIFDKCAESILGIEVYQNDISNFSLEESGGTSSSWGSGVVFSIAGDKVYFITNAHVVGNSKNVTVEVTTKQGTKFTKIKVIGIDQKTDLAVLECDPSEHSDYKFVPIEFGNSKQVKTGEQVFVIGNPQGQNFSHSITDGIISALDRKLDPASPAFIQTNATMNSGNSGGGAFDSMGRFIGMPCRKLTGTGVEGMGFLIASNDIISVTESLLKQGYVSRPMLGITPKFINPLLAQKFSIKIGVMIVSINENSNLPGVGVRAKDIITKVNDKEIKAIEDLYEEIKKFQIGDKIKLNIFRPGSERMQQPSNEFEVVVTLSEEKGTQQSSQQQTPQPQQPSEERW
ncbi:MAG: trypsin-like peptidase domain-containing protein [Oscillospiraceae bacterium]|jgi:serine protease Do|nr:trypsin-like peptidase domain-containing protein [Oscillospiraceae bacterium]